MASIPTSGPETGPVLSNYLTALAADVAGDVAAYRRGSIQSHRAYLSGAAKLVEARGACRRGEWGPFLERAGVTPRAARDMMMLSRAGMTAERMTDLGGVRAALEALREAAAGAVGAAGDVLDAGEGEKPATVAVISGDDAPVGAAEGLPERRSGGVPAGVGTEYRDTEVWPGEGSAHRLKRLRGERRAAGRCADCGAWSGDAYRCPSCVTIRATANERAASRRRIGRALEGRIREAAARGKGVRLSADDVRKLVDGEQEAFGAQLARVGKRR